MMVLLVYFLIAAVAAVAASAVIGLFLTNFIIDRFITSDRAKKETPSTHRPWRFECFSRHQTQARLAGVLIRRR
jgi:multidrug efflux pump subunit AcrB